LNRIQQRRRGIRIPGAWDPFEFAVTTLVLGPQPGATGRSRLTALVEECGDPLELTGESVADAVDAGPDRLFPTPDALAGAALGTLGLPERRARALGALCAAVASKELVLDAGIGPGTAASLEQLESLNGVDESSAQRIALRGLGDPDAFPTSDAILRRALVPRGASPLSARALARRAERWQPWRGYAAMLLWESQSGAPSAPSRVSSARLRSIPQR
jgi:DNA-3-methyladenine glycosylase II